MFWFGDDVPFRVILCYLVYECVDNDIVGVDMVAHHKDPCLWVYNAWDYDVLKLVCVLCVEMETTTNLDIEWLTPWPYHQQHHCQKVA